jgi:hypothetical protein
MREWPKKGRGFLRPRVFYQKGVVMNQDMNMGMMLCMLAGVLFSLVILVLVIAQTILFRVGSFSKISPQLCSSQS